jgi:hypothetical protein
VKIISYIDNYFDNSFQESKTSNLETEITKEIRSFKEAIFYDDYDFKTMEEYITAIITQLENDTKRLKKTETSEIEIEIEIAKYQRCLSFARNIDFFEQIIDIPKGNIGTKGPFCMFFLSNNKVDPLPDLNPDINPDEFQDIQLLNTIISEMNTVINQILNPNKADGATLVNMGKSLWTCRNNLISPQQGRTALIDQCYNPPQLSSTRRTWQTPMTPLCEKIFMCQTIINTTLNMLNFIKMFIYDPIFANIGSNLDNAERALEKINDIYELIPMDQRYHIPSSMKFTRLETDNITKYAEFIERILVSPEGYCISEKRLNNIAEFFGEIQREIHIFKDKNYGNDDEDEEETILTSLATLVVDLIESNMIGGGNNKYKIHGTDTYYQLEIPDIEDIPQYCYDEELFTQNILLSLALLSSRTNNIKLRTYILNLLDMYWMVRFDQMEDWYLMMLTDCKLKNKMLSTYCNTLNRFISNAVAARDPNKNDIEFFPNQPVPAIIYSQAQGKGQDKEPVYVSSSTSSSSTSSSRWGGGRKQMRGGISSRSGSKACNDSPSILVKTDNTFEDDVVSLLNPNDILFTAFLLASLTKTQDELSHDFLPYLKKLVYTLISSNYKPVIDAFVAKLEKLITDNPGNAADQATIIKNFIQELRSNTTVPETEWNYYSSILKFLDNRCKKIDSVNIVMIANVKKYPFLSRLQNYGYFWQFEKDPTKLSSDDDDNSSYFYKYLDGSIVTIGGGKFSNAHLVYFADNSTSTRKLIPIYKNQNISGNVKLENNINYVSSASVIQFENSSYVFYYGPGLLDPANQNPIPKSKFFGPLANQVIDRIEIVPPDVKMAGGGNVHLQEYRQIIKDIQRDQDINLPGSRYARIFMIDGINKFIAMFGVVDGFVDISGDLGSIGFIEDGDSYSGITFTLTEIPATATATAVPECIIELKTGKGKVVKSDTTIDNVSDFIIWLESSTESPKLDDFLSEDCPANILFAQWQSWRRLYTFADAIYRRIPSNVKTAILTQMGLQSNRDKDKILRRRMITEIIITLKSFGDSYQVDYVKKISEYLKQKYNLSVSIRSTDKNVGGEGLLISCPFWLIGTGIRPHYDFYTKYATFFGNREFKETVDVEDGSGKSSKVTIGLKPGCVEYNPISTITTDSSLVDIPSIISEITSYSKSIVELSKLAPALSFASVVSPTSASVMEVASTSTSALASASAFAPPPPLVPPTKWPPISIDESKLQEQIKLFKAMIVHFTAATAVAAAATAVAAAATITIAAAANMLTAALQSEVLTAVANVVETNIVTELCIMSMANLCLEAGINPAAMGNPFGQSINRIVSAGGGGIGGGSKNLNKINQIGGAAFIIDEKTTINGLSNLLTKISTINDLLKIIGSKETIKGEINVFGQLSLEKIKLLDKILSKWDIRGKTQTIQNTANEIKTGFTKTNPLTEYITSFARDNIIGHYVDELIEINTTYISELNRNIDNFGEFMTKVETVEEFKSTRSSGRDTDASKEMAKEREMSLLIQDYKVKQKNDSSKFKALKNKLEQSFEKVQDEWQRKVNENKKITEKQKASFENAQIKLKQDLQKIQTQEQQQQQKQEQEARSFAEAKIKENDPITVRKFGLELIQSTNGFIKQLYDQCKKISNITMFRSNKIQPSTDRGGGAKTQRRYKKKHVTRKKQLNKRHKRLSRKQLKKGQKSKPVRFSKKIRRHHY